MTCPKCDRLDKKYRKARRAMNSAQESLRTIMLRLESDTKGLCDRQDDCYAALAYIGKAKDELSEM